MKEVDLAYKDSCCMPEPCCLPSPREPSYPGTYITVPEDSEMEIPDSGEITFKFRVRRETEEKTGEKCCKYDLDLMAITGVKGDPEEPDESESDSAAIRISAAFKGKKK